MASGLRRELGLAAAVSVVVGSMIGVGIFLGPSEIAPVVPTPGLALLAWVLGGLLVFCGALTYAELGAAMPESGGIYAYMREAYGPFVAFLTGWSGFAVGKAASTSALAVAFSRFAGPGLGLSGAGQTVLSVALILALMAFNIFGVRNVGRLAVVAMVVKVGAILFVAVGGVVVLAGQFPSLAAQPFAPPGSTVGSIVSAFGLALIPVFFAYDGWANSTQVAEEVRDPARNVPRSVILGTLAVIVAYALVNLAYFLALGTQGVAAEGAASRTAERLVGPIGAAVITGAILVSIVGTINAVTLSGPRIAFAMSRDGVFFRAIERVNRFGTPGWSIALQSAISIGLVLLPPIGGRSVFSTLLDYIIFDSFLFYALGAGAVFILRRKRPELPRPYKVPFYPVVPLIFILGSAAFLVNTVATRPLESLGGIALVAAGAPIYLWQTHVNRARRLREGRFVLRRP